MFESLLLQAFKMWFGFWTVFVWVDMMEFLFCPFAYIYFFLCVSLAVLPQTLKQITIKYLNYELFLLLLLLLLLPIGSTHEHISLTHLWSCRISWFLSYQANPHTAGCSSRGGPLCWPCTAISPSHLGPWHCSPRPDHFCSSSPSSYEETKDNRLKKIQWNSCLQ